MDIKDVYNDLQHTEWSKHKYIAIENGRYIYPEDVNKNNRNTRTGNKNPYVKRSHLGIAKSKTKVRTKVGHNYNVDMIYGPKDRSKRPKWQQNVLNRVDSKMNSIMKTTQEGSRERSTELAKEVIKAADTYSKIMDTFIQITGNKEATNSQVAQWLADSGRANLATRLFESTSIIERFNEELYEKNIDKSVYNQYDAAMNKVNRY